MSGHVLKWIGLVLFITTVGAMSLYLFTRDELEVADQSASVIGAFLALSSLALTLYGMLADRLARSTSTPTSPEETITAAKKALTDLVARQWRTEAAIRSLGDPEPIPISWHLVDDAGVMDHPRLVGEHLLTFSGSSDQVPKLVHAFRGLRRRRLVIAGGPGTGKTTLAIQLLLHLAGPGRDEADPVPVLVPVNGWDTRAHPRLHDWLATRLPLDYPALTAPQFGTDAAKALLDHGHILPILDGLDEIPNDARTQVIAALNRWLGNDDSFILTSRSTEYDHAVKQAGDVLNAAAVIAPAVISAADAETYLRTCLPPIPRHDWTPIWAALHSASHPGLSRLTETALGLWLIRTVYITTAIDPAPLTSPLAQQETTLRTHLFDHLIAAVIDSRPPSSDPAAHFRPRTAWNPDRARDHLAYLARVLRDHDTYDLVWWQLAQHTFSHAERRRTALQAVLAGALVGGLVGGLLIGGLMDSLTGVEELMSAGMVGLVGAGVVGLTVGHTIWRGTWFIETPGYADLHLSGRATDLIKYVRQALANSLKVQLKVGITVGLFLLPYGFPYGLPYELTLEIAAGLAFTLTLWLALLLAFGLAFGLAAGLATGVIKWAEHPASSTIATTPLTSWKADRSLTLLRVVTLGLVVVPIVGLLCGVVAVLVQAFLFGRFEFGLSCWLMAWLKEGLKHGLWIGFVASLVAGPTAGLLVGNHHAWLAYTISVRRLVKKEHLPRKLMDFLDDAHRLGLLRTVGPIYQFRHAELQDHLAALPSPSSNPPIRPQHQDPPKLPPESEQPHPATSGLIRHLPAQLLRSGHLELKRTDEAGFSLPSPVPGSPPEGLPAGASRLSSPPTERSEGADLTGGKRRPHSRLGARPTYF